MVALWFEETFRGSARSTPRVEADPDVFRYELSTFSG
jgi:hypothetical protein